MDNHPGNTKEFLTHKFMNKNLHHTLGAVLLLWAGIGTAATGPGDLNLRATGELSSSGEAVSARRETTSFGRHLLECLTEANVKLTMNEEQILAMTPDKSRMSTAEAEVELPEGMYFTGFLQYTEVNGKMHIPRGLYSFSQADGLQRHLVTRLNASINGGGIYHDNCLIGSSCQPIPKSNKSTVEWRVMKWDTDTWTSPDGNPDGINTWEMVVTDADINPVDNKAYGVWDYYLVGLDYDSLEATQLANVRVDCSAFAISNDGVGYIVSRYGELYRLDLTTYETTLVGQLDFTYFHALQSMAFDRRTNKLYLACAGGDYDSMTMYGRLSEVNIEDATTKLVGYFPEMEEYTTLNICYMPESGAPGKIEGLKASFADVSSEADVSFTLPVNTSGGKSLESDVQWNAYIGNSTETVASGSGHPGEDVCIKIEVPEGRVKIVAVASNAEGSGDRAAIWTWGGSDVPGVKDPAVSMSQSSSEAEITWTVSSEGANGGYADMSDVTFKVTRNPDNKVVAEGLTGGSFTDDMSQIPYCGYTYTITPVKEGIEYVGATTDMIYAGAPRILPYVQDFDTEASTYEFRILNKSDIGWNITWDWSVEGVMRNEPDAYQDADNWAISPALEMKAGMTYIISYEDANMGDSVDMLGVSVGRGDDPDLYEVLKAPEAVTAYMYDSMEKHRLTFICKESGAYHVAFHAASKANEGYIFVDNVKVEEGLPSNVPAKPTDMSVVSVAGGVLTAEITVTAPELTLAGDKITSLTSLNLYRDDDTSPCATLDNPQPGKVYTISDPDAYNGRVTYTVSASNANGEGEKAEASAYIGIDKPDIPENLKVKDNLDGSLLLSWTPNPVGINGGLVDVDELSYTLYTFDDNGRTALASDIQDCKIEVSGIPTKGKQAPLVFYLTASNELGESEMAEFPVVFSGEPVSVPFMEGFRQNNLAGTWLSSSYGMKWNIYSGMSADNDDYCMGAKAQDYDAHGTLQSAKFSLANAEKPKLCFAFYNAPGVNNSIGVSVHPDGQEAESIFVYDMKVSDDEEGWLNCIIDLDDYKNCSYITLGFRIAINDEEANIVLIDDVNLRDVPQDNLTLYLSAPNRTTAGATAHLEATVHNVGINPASGYSVRIYVNDDVVGEVDGEDLGSFERSDISIDVPVSVLNETESVVRCEVAYPADGLAYDNTAESYMFVAEPKFNKVQELNKDVSAGNAELTWIRPSAESVVVEDFEGVAAFLYDGFGDWTVYDEDGGWMNPPFSNPFPGNDGPSAFFTVDFTAAGYRIEDGSDYAGHSSTSYVGAMTNYSTQTRDWLISPLLSGNAQTISFYAKSLGGWYEDDFVVMASSNGRELTDFSPVLPRTKATGQWEKYEAELPEGTKFFAIKTESVDGGFFMVDDIEFELPARTLEGYNVYDNKKLVATLDAETMRYIGPATGNYCVTALYKEGESAPVSADNSGIADVAATGVKITAIHDAIVIEGADGAEVVVTDVEGLILRHVAKSTEKLTFQMPKGIYLVKAGTKVAKVIVK